MKENFGESSKTILGRRSRKEGGELKSRNVYHSNKDQRRKARQRDSWIRFQRGTCHLKQSTLTNCLNGLSALAKFSRQSTVNINEQSRRVLFNCSWGRKWSHLRTFHCSSSSKKNSYLFSGRIDTVSKKADTVATSSDRFSRESVQVKTCLSGNIVGNGSVAFLLNILL